MSPPPDPIDVALILDALRQPVMVFDAAGAPVRLNRAAVEALGFDASVLDADPYMSAVASLNIRLLDGGPLPPAQLPSRRALLGDPVAREIYRFTNARGRELVVEATATPLTAGDRLTGAVVVWTDLTERVEAEASLREALDRGAREEELLRKLNRTLHAYSHSDQALMRASDEPAYLDEVCRIIVEECGHAMVWVGLAEDDEQKSVRPVASAGFEQGYLETLKITWADTERGRGPTGTAVRTGQPYICRNMLTDPRFAPWREQALRRGYAASIALPLAAGGKVFGALTIYCREPDPFSDEEVRLLTKLAGDFAYGVQVLRLRAAHIRTVEALRESEQRYRTLVELAADAIIAHQDGRFVYANAAALRLYGAEALEQLIGRGVLDRIDAEDRDLVRRRMADLAAGRPTSLRDLRLLRLDGTQVPVEATSAAIVHQGRPAVQVIIRDITERKRTEEALREADRRKDVFLATLSHELRTPLNAIVGWSQMLLGGSLDAASTRRAIEVIARNAIAQTQIVNDLLDVSRIITGKVTIAPQDLDLAEVLSQAIESVRPAAQAKGIELNVHLVPGLIVSGDASRLQQVFWNLLSNAVKFTPASGRVSLTLSREASYVTVRVCDTGMGIPQAFLPSVFDRFSQADASTSRQHAGLGLGLAIARHLVELHGGTVQAESDGEGQGATFTVRFPIRAVDRAEPCGEVAARSAVSDGRTGEPSAGSDRLAGVRILVVDDEADARQLVKAVLERQKADVTLAASTSDAMDELARKAFDVLIADIAMPGEDGYVLIRRVRAISPIPAIALTAYGRDEDRAKAFASGYQQHVTKPVMPWELVQAVEEVVGT